MASLSHDAGGTHRIEFFAGTKRSRIRLGRISQRMATTIFHHVEHLIGAKASGDAAPEKTIQWLRDIDNKLHARIARAGLVAARAATKPAETIGWLLDTYKARKYPTYKPGTILTQEQTNGSMLAYFTAQKAIVEISEADADGFRDFLISPTRSGGQGLAESTANKRCSIASKLLKYAIKARIIDRNPFDEVERGNRPAESFEFVGAELSLAVMDQLPDSQWKLLFALARWGGLRVGSEPRRLRWGDVDWERHRFTVHSPKTERHRGHATRDVPIFPELAKAFDERYLEADEGDELVLPFLVGRTDASLRGPLEKAIFRGRAASFGRVCGTTCGP